LENIQEQSLEEVKVASNLSGWGPKAIDESVVPFPKDMSYIIHYKVATKKFDEALALMYIHRSWRSKKIPCAYGTDEDWVRFQVDRALNEYVPKIGPFPERNTYRHTAINLLELAIYANAPVEFIEKLITDDSVFQGFNVNSRRIAALGIRGTDVVYIDIEITTHLHAAINNKNAILNKINTEEHDSQELKSLHSELKNSNDIINLLIARGADTNHVKWEGCYIDSQTDNGWNTYTRGSWKSLNSFS
ncbi:MAG: hypothetical protein JSR46_06735, partial [Verrucomicrobia bacterium]|nr:hypothetical protein [Verrucomicrobiota bacterium]